MRSGEHRCSIEEFLDYATALDPDFARRIEGALPAEIDDYQSLYGRELPASYRCFLSRMGRKPLRMSDPNDDTSLPCLTDHLRSEVLTGLTPLPPGCVLIALGEGGYFSELYLEPVGAGEPIVVHGVLGELRGKRADSLVSWLFKMAFASLVIGRSPCIAGLSDVGADTERGRGAGSPRNQEAALLSRANVLSVGLGFQRERFSDSLTLSATRSGAALQCYAPEHRAFDVWLGARSKEEADELAATFIEELGLKRLGEVRE